ncbi:TetR/AcrR family transcriptional regulator [Streptomyces sp. NPDC059639]|uniref:TetR/AcrR family transcriptional regulator n=1 Tax=Streptomyces sp. NPDC059639 TaxID=3346891 RepID=UPI0036C4BB88
MSLRERKAELTRRRIVDEAMRRFVADGYEQTTLESIAAAVDLSTVTIYRYFGSKEMIILEGFQEKYGPYLSTLREQPAEADVPTVLSRAIQARLTMTAEDRESVLMARNVIDEAPAARARLWDILAEHRSATTEVIAERSGSAPDDMAVQLAARIAVLIAETASDRFRADPDGAEPQDIARDLMRVLRDGKVLLPDPDA